MRGGSVLHGIDSSYVAFCRVRRACAMVAAEEIDSAVGSWQRS